MKILNEKEELLLLVVLATVNAIPTGCEQQNT